MHSMLHGIDAGLPAQHAVQAQHTHSMLGVADAGLTRLFFSITASVSLTKNLGLCDFNNVLTVETLLCHLKNVLMVGYL